MKVFFMGLNVEEVGLEKHFSEGTLIEVDSLEEAQIIFTKFEKIDQQLMDSAKGLKYIGIFATGTDKVDISYAESIGVKVSNVPGYSTNSVAEFVLAAVLAELRFLFPANARANAGDYSESGFEVNEISSLSIGVVGLGEIGSKVASLFSSLGAEVLYWSENSRDARYKYMQLDDLLARCDVISINLAANQDTIDLINSQLIERIKNNAILINTSPMEILDTEAILGKLANNSQFRFIYDHSDEIEHSLNQQFTKHQNCRAYPPIAYISNQASEAKKEIFQKNLDTFLGGA